MAGAPPVDAPARSARWREWATKAAVEAALIVLSVLVALALDEWRDDRERAQRVTVAVRGVRAELAANREAMTRAQAFHRATHDSLRTYAASGTLPPRSIYYDRGMFRPARPLATAWQAARETGATSDMPYALVLALSDVYSRQERYEALAGQLAADVMIDTRRRGADAVLRDGYAGFLTLAEDFANREDALANAYDRALAQIPARR